MILIDKSSFLDKCLKRTPAEIAEYKEKDYIRNHKRKSKALFGLIK